MIRDDIINFLQRHNDSYTTTQIAMAIKASTGRVHTILMDLWSEGVVGAETIKAQGTYHVRIYMVWWLL